MRLVLNWKISLFSVILFPVLLYLGYWQLQRADEKQDILQQLSKQSKAEPVLLTKANMRTLDDYHPVYVDGQFEVNKYWLQEGKIVKGFPGYNVLMPFTTEFSTFIVDRGWINSSQDREILPVFESIETSQRIEGIVVKPNQVALIDESKNAQVSWPHRVLSIDIPELSKHYNKTSTHKIILSPRVIKLVEYDKNALTITPIKINIKPEKHRAYAFQWFGMAATLFILWLITNTNITTYLRKR